MTLPNEPDITDRVPYTFKCDVSNIVDGDTVDVEIDLGFDINATRTVRLRDIDTSVIHFVENSSEEYREGIEHRNSLIDWVIHTQRVSDERFPFVLYSEEYNTGSYGRIIGDIWSPVTEEWASRMQYDAYDTVELYED